MAKRSGGSQTGQKGLILLLVLVAVAAFLIVRSTFHTVRVIQVTNVSAEEARFIAQASGIKDGARLDRLNEEAVRAALQPYGQWEFLSLETQEGGTVVLHMRRRTPCAVVHYAGSTLLLDEYCQVVSNRQSEENAEGLMEIRGMDIRTAQEGALLGVDDLNQAAGVARVLSALVETGALSRVQELNAANLDNLYMITRSGVRVQLGDSENMRVKCLWMNGVLDSLEAEGRAGGRVDVSTGTSAVYSPE